MVHKKMNRLYFIIFGSLVLTLIPFMIWLVLSPQSLQSVSIYGTFIATFVLVIVTAWYSIVTSEILKDSQRDREIRWIERKLRGLYYPLLNNLSDYLSDLDSDFPLKSIDAIRNRLYLGSSVLRKVLEELRESVRGMPEPRDLSMKVCNLVSSEASELQNRLEQLTTSETEEEKKGH